MASIFIKETPYDSRAFIDLDVDFIHRRKTARARLEASLARGAVQRVIPVTDSGPADVVASFLCDPIDARSCGERGA